MAVSGDRRKPVVSRNRILKILEKRGISWDQVTLTELEQALRDYRDLHPDARFGRADRAILAYSDFALRNRALFREKWSEAKLLAVNPKNWHDFARQFEGLAAREAEAFRSGTYNAPFEIYGNHLRCQWTSNRDDELDLRFDVLAAEAGQHLGAAPGIKQSIRQTEVGSWADFWKYCLWFYLGEARDSTIPDPLRTSVKFCLHLALHSDSSPRRASGKPHGISMMHDTSAVFERLKKMMPKLLSKMREDLRTRPLRRDFVLLNKPWVYREDQNRPVFRYYHEDYDDLPGAIRILRNYHLVEDSDIRTNVPHYVMTEEFAEHLENASGPLDGYAPEPASSVQPGKTEPSGELAANQAQAASDAMDIRSAPESASDPAADPESPGRPKKRGRKRQFSQQQLDQARQMKSDGKGNNEIAKVLYGSAPTAAQRRSVPTTLKHHFGSRPTLEE